MLVCVALFRKTMTALACAGLLAFSGVSALAQGPEVAPNQTLPQQPPLPQAPSVPEGQPEITTFEKWGVQCGTPGQEGRCIAFQNIATEGGQTPVMLVRVGFLPTAEGERAAMEIVLPLGIYLKFGVAIEVDGEGVARDYFDHCARGGCFALFEFDSVLTDTFKKGRQAKVVFQDGTQETVEIPFSLQGFAAAFEQLKS